MIRYLVSIFDARSRTLNIPKGPAVVITALLIHQVLGTPIGGRQIGEKVDADLRLHISNVTSCKGKYPKISELDCLITADLVGDLFKIVFGMYAMTAFLCPSSNDVVSPDYLHIFKEPDNIGSFDFSVVVLEKLVSSIEAHNDCLTSVLGGNLLSLLIIYLDFKDTNIVPIPLKRKLPRVAVWSTSMINAVESMDCISWDSAMYGNLAVKVVSDTPFTCNPITTYVTAKKSYDDLRNFVLSICPEVHHKLALFQLEHEMPGKLARLLSNGMLGFMLDSMDLIHLPLFTSGFYYLLVVNLKRKRFEVLIPNNKLHLVQKEVYVAIRNFKMSFSLAYKNSLVNINDMETAFRSVCTSEREKAMAAFM